MNENATYEQLMLLPSDELTDGQKLFLTVHNEMVMAGQKAAECLLIVANDMLRMRDEELYRAAGFETFTDYVETALNIKERQAYNWISILKLPAEYLKQNAKMGVSKLAAIASASEDVAEELMSDEATSGKTVRELNAIIKEKERELAEKDKQLSLSEDDLMNKDDQIRELEEELEAERAKKPDAAPDADNSEYEAKIKDLNGQLEQARKDLTTANNKLETSEAKVKELNAKKQKVVEKTVEKTVEVENPKTKEALEAAQKEAEAAKAEKAAAEEKARKAEEELTAYKKSQEAVATFKIRAGSLFEAWDTVMDAVKQMKAADPEYAAKCIAKLVAFSDTVKSDIEEVQK